MVNTETQYGVGTQVKMRLPIFTGALGSTEIARKNWEHFATGAAIAGITIVCGENVCGIDPGLEMDANGKVKRAPNMARRVEQYRRYHEGYGDMIVQMNVEDTRLGVAEYVIGQLGVECIELKWGQGAKCIGGEIQVDSLERALELQKRGYLVTPDPSNPANQAAFSDGALKHFERHSRLGFVDQDGFMKEVERIRKLGAQARHPQDRRLSDARAGHGHQVGVGRQARPADHRRRSGRHRHEPLAHDGGVGRPDVLSPVA